MATSRGRPVGAKVFLEGKEVPFIGCTINSTVNEASIAYIDLIPHYTINHVKPRTHVAIAVRDYHNIKQNFPYVLAWEGEVFGYNFQKTPESRMFTLSAIDYTSYWDNVLNYFFNALTSLGKMDNTIPLGLTLNDVDKQNISVTPVAHSTASVFLEIVKAELEKTDADGRQHDFLDAFVAVLKKFGEINEFYSSSAERLRLNDRILLKSAGNLKQYLEEQEALDWFKGVTGGASGFATLRTIVQDLMSVLFHDGVTLPFPSRALTSQTLSQFLTKDQLKTGKKETISQFVFKPNMYMMPPPMCNVFYPDEYSSFVFNRNFFQEPTRLIYKPEMSLPFGGGGVAMPHSYAPASFESFMFKGPGYTPDIDATKDIATKADPGKYNDPDPTAPSGKKREGQFLTNEERMKGILISMEGMVPAATEFRAALRGANRATYSKSVANYMFYKKRFQTRSLQITSHLKMSVIPGFNVLVLDPSDAGQNVLAYCTTVTHRIYATEGGHTNVTLSYARTIDEQQSASGALGGPPVPPWFTESFGKIGVGSVSDEAKKELKEGFDGSVYVSADGKGLSEIYSSLIGELGSKAITEYYRDDPTLIGAVNRLIRDYKLYKKKPDADVMSYIAKITDRDYVRIRDSYEFVSAKTQTHDLREENFVEFTGGSLSSSGRPDAAQIEARQAVIKKYRDALKAQRGFHG